MIFIIVVLTVDFLLTVNLTVCPVQLNLEMVKFFMEILNVVWELEIIEITKNFGNNLSFNVFHV